MNSKIFKSDVVRIIRDIMYGEIPDLPHYSLFARGGSRELYIAPNSMKKDQDGSFVILSDLSRENVALFFSDDTSHSGCVAKISEEINKHIKKDRKRKIISAFRERAKKDFEIFLESMENSIIDLLNDEKKNS